MFPGLYINLNLGTEKGDGGTEGSVVHHVGFIVDNVQKRVAEWKASGVAVLPGNNSAPSLRATQLPELHDVRTERGQTFSIDREACGNRLLLRDAGTFKLEQAVAGRKRELPAGRRSWCQAHRGAIEPLP
jgi:hypothetical protein